MAIKDQAMAMRSCVAIKDQATMIMRWCVAIKDQATMSIRCVAIKDQATLIIVCVAITDQATTTKDAAITDRATHNGGGTR